MKKARIIFKKSQKGLDFFRKKYIIIYGNIFFERKIKT